MFIDKIKITAKAGNGGNGKISFMTQKYVPNGGPDGGDGGRGGSVYFVADASRNTLIDYYHKRKYIAEDGKAGDANNCYGKSGKDIILRVPVGTLIRDAESGKIIADMFYEGEKKLILQGGKGGKGNSKFANSRRQSPHFAQNGETTVARQLILELKVLADVGIVGLPNAGKSTLLSVISDAKPKIADYHFSTLSPNLGVVKYYDNSFVAADIPGLIEGASDGAGLGHNFLRHIERTRLILHIVDISAVEGRLPYDDYKIINNELKKFSPTLAKLPQIIVCNKSDSYDSEKNLKEFKSKLKGKQVFSISAITKQGINELLASVVAKLQELPKPAPFEFQPFEYQKPDIDSYEVTQLQTDVYIVEGGFIDNLLRRINFSDPQSFMYFQKLLRDKGVIDELRQNGAKNGDTIIVGDTEFDFDI